MPPIDAFTSLVMNLFGSRGRAKVSSEKGRSLFLAVEMESQVLALRVVVVVVVVVVMNLK